MLRYRGTVRSKPLRLLTEAFSCYWDGLLTIFVSTRELLTH